MDRLRLFIACAAVALVVAIGAVVALAAPGAVGNAASPNAGAARAEYCPPAELARRQAAVRRFKKQMLAQRRKYFRTHKSKRDRIRFVKKQLRQLRYLQRQVALCD